MEQENRQTCENCKFFMKYYVKRNAKLQYIHRGHCFHKYWQDLRRKKPTVNCEFWEDEALQKEERRQSIKETLGNLSESLKIIALILKDDNQ